MHMTKAKLKDGRVLDGCVWTVRPSEGWFTLVIGDDEVKIKMSDCESVITENERVSINRVENVDELARWRRMANEERERVR